MRKRRKSQVEQGFFYILALFIIGSILLLGVKYVGKLLTQVEQIDLVEFKTSLQDDVDIMSTKYGSWKKKAYVVPKDIKKVCFFTIDKYSPACNNHEDLDLIMCDAWKDGVQNVMTVPFVLETPINLSRMEMDNSEFPKGFNCFDAVSKRIEIKITGKGNGVVISSP